MIFAVVMLAGLLWNQWSFLVLFSIIHFGCWWEYLQLLEKIHYTRFDVYCKQGFMLAGFGIVLLCCGPLFHINGYALRDNFALPVSVAGFVLLVIGIFRQRTIAVKSFGAAALGLLYISLSWGLMISLFQWHGALHIHDRMFVLGPGYEIPVIIIASIWINDTMAYIVGSIIGKTPLSRISPKKTWEGTIGGIILSILAVSFLLPLILFGEKGFAFLSFFGPVAGIAAVAGTFGDLLESKLKRMAGVKDSGHFMPGHGGFLDRFDSLLIAVPAVFLYLFYF